MTAYWAPDDIGLDPTDYTDGQVPVKDASGVFVPGAGGGGVEELSDLIDVDTSGATDGDALVYDNGLWVPGEVSGGGGDAAGTYTEVVGDDTETSFDISHDLDTAAVVAGVIEVASGDALVHGSDFTWLVLDDNTIRVVFASAPDADDARVVVLASGGSGGGGGGGGAVGSRVFKSNTSHATNVAWTDVDYDDLEIVDLATDNTFITLAQDGLYRVTASLYSTNSDALTHIYINAVAVAMTRYSGGGTVSGRNLSWEGKAVSGDEVHVAFNGGLTTNTSDGRSPATLNWLAITKIA